MKSFKEIREASIHSNNPSQGSSLRAVGYDELDMKNIVKDVISRIPEDDGPHTSKVGDAPNFQTVADPSSVINQPSSEGNREHPFATAPRMSGKPGKNIKASGIALHPEDLTGAVASVAIGEAKDEGEYDYEGDMAMTQLRSILHNAKMLHDMLEPNTNLPEWVQLKITLAEDYIVTAAQYMHAEMNEANLTPYRNTELGARSTKRAGQPRASISKQFWRPPEGFTKKGIEKTPTSKVKKEEVEQVTELSQKTKDSYVAKRGSQLSSMMYGSDKHYNKLSGKKQANAVKGIKRALNKEEVEQVDEVITKSTPTGEVIHDFVHSENPKFAGKSKKERIRMALGAKYAMMRGKK